MTAQERVVESQISHLSPAVQAAVARGQKDISLISGLLMIGTIILSLFLGAFVFKNATGELIVSGILLGVVLGWLWWSFSIPRWREWALKQPGVDPDQLQKAAEIAGLVWPKGHFFEKTEFRFKK
jgi:Na+/proline symporter